MIEPLTLAIIALTLLIGWFLYLQNRKTEKIIQSDMSYEETTTDGKKVKGKIRSRWDYSYLPEISRAFFKTQPSLVVAIILLLLLVGLYALFRENSFLELVKVNFGAILGVLIKGKDE